MGRLDDIVARNEKAIKRDSLLTTALSKLGDDKPAAPVAPFTLASQRKSGTATWKVLVTMVLVGIVFGFYECHQMDLVKQDDARRLREVK